MFSISRQIFIYFIPSLVELFGAIFASAPPSHFSVPPGGIIWVTQRITQNLKLAVDLLDHSGAPAKEKTHCPHQPWHRSGTIISYLKCHFIPYFFVAFHDRCRHWKRTCGRWRRSADPPPGRSTAWPVHRIREDSPRKVFPSPTRPRSTFKIPSKCARSKKCKAFLEDGCAGDGGNKSSSNTLKARTPKACANETGE